jgi:hypothetical protein
MSKTLNSYRMANRAPKQTWTEDLDNRLRQAIEQYGEHCWTSISSVMNILPRVCRSRWKVLNESMKPWTSSEDIALEQLACNDSICSKSKWVHIGQTMGRSSTECQQRWRTIGRRKERVNKDFTGWNTAPISPAEMPVPIIFPSVPYGFGPDDLIPSPTDKDGQWDWDADDWHW